MSFELLVFIYFLPTFCVILLGLLGIKSSTGDHGIAVIFCNIFFGWTIIGYIVCWALIDEGWKS